ncbi:MAG: thiamine pyrophosphate-binding protein [Armatimonadota bacterium]|nr:thiamine pyrophosphate-binding protein [Armatimonadota bacterium]MDR7444843.1 thiamine pyrophosphate-binding protein [Armatimonadota bacterium]MDR7570009.1 thiamine pyrophosphate-binding protein [Armatimonadota bacterium]MDR7615173.1 thiamine pyrophosphate-binding protein [Armatimonadota bacterium]
MGERGPEYGSDLIVELMRRCGIEYAALNPGATFRGIHDSIVNYAGNRSPELILCTHEEIAVAVAHGYAKAKHRPMVALVHDVVGLQHASMAIFNAWCDREPVLVIGGTGPLDATQRRPWIDWVHTAHVQANLVRDYVKWDDQPASLRAIPASFYRAYRLAIQEPRGPVYLCYDVALQEARLEEPVEIPDPESYLRVTRLAPEEEALDQVARWLVESSFPVLLADRVGRDPQAIPHLVELAEEVGAAVVDTGRRHNFPSSHPLDVSDAREEVLAQADLVVALEVYDLFGALRAPVHPRSRESRSLVAPTARIVHITLGDLHARGWVHDINEPQPTTLTVLADTTVTLPLLVERVRRRLRRSEAGRGAREQRRRYLEDLHTSLQQGVRRGLEERWGERPVSPPRLAYEVWQAIRGIPWQLANGWLGGWPRRLWVFEEPDCFLGHNEGAGLGYGMGVSIGACLAHRSTERLVVNLQSEGDFLYTPGALYTASAYRLPLLIVLVNNRSYYNDEEHQAEVARLRGRPVENRGIGTRLDHPDVDYRKLAESFGVYAEGRVEDPTALPEALRRAVTVCMEERCPALVEVLCAPR